MARALKNSSSISPAPKAGANKLLQAKGAINDCFQAKCAQNKSLPGDFMHEVPQEAINAAQKNSTGKPALNMNKIVGSCDILMLCLDTLRWDVAYEEEQNGGTPVLNRYGNWVQSFAAGNFTLPSHHAMFAGFLPAPVTARSIGERELLFFPQNVHMGKTPATAFAFSEATFIQGLASAGYQTNCIGGVSFFDKRSALGRVFPAMFQHSFWRPAFGCTQKQSINAQVDFICKRLAQTPAEQPVFYYLNVSTIHYPNSFYIKNSKSGSKSKNGVGNDTKQSHAAALRYVDACLEPLFAAFKKRKRTFAKNNNTTFVIALSDHGTCYGEEGFIFHGLPNPVVNTVPYKHFFL